MRGKELSIKDVLEGVEPVRTRGERESIFRDFVWTFFMDGPYINHGLMLFLSSKISGLYCITNYRNAYTGQHFASS